MKETGIIMSRDHPQKIIDLLKTQTRRTWGLEQINLRPDDWYLEKGDGLVMCNRETGERLPVNKPQIGKPYGLVCPYGQARDRLWVRETWASEKRYNHLKPSEIPDTAKIYFIDINTHRAGGYSLFVEMGKVRSSMFMCKWMSRITLEITEVRVERVQEISLVDVKAEGIPAYTLARGVLANEPPDPRWNFIELWDSLNKKRGYGWEANCWVWVISFRRV